MDIVIKSVEWDTKIPFKNATSKFGEDKLLDLFPGMSRFVSLFLLPPVALTPVSVISICTMSSPHQGMWLNRDKQEEVVVLLYEHINCNNAVLGALESHFPSCHVYARLALKESTSPHSDLPVTGILKRALLSPPFPASLQFGFSDNWYHEISDRAF